MWPFWPLAFRARYLYNLHLFSGHPIEQRNDRPEYRADVL
mgnify:CR=1 FL=1